ncbi:hypothetical protein PIB30_085615 [Stylosanthes scabra]|uniref:Uncharacterized protein n=1 Tax=Stylosanthes scabra TaxID=79078 RepID=A0ABU6QTR4_9FABA|nr:hypothetical protein [Stylosanthes scabra]
MLDSWWDFQKQSNRAAACFSPRGCTCLDIHSWRPLSRARTRATPLLHLTVPKFHSGCSLSTSCHRTPLCLPSHEPRDRVVPPCELTVGRVALGQSCNYGYATACSSPRDRTGPKNKQNGPPIKARDRAITSIA